MILMSQKLFFGSDLMNSPVACREHTHAKKVEHTTTMHTTEKHATGQPSQHTQRTTEKVQHHSSAATGTAKEE